MKRKIIHLDMDAFFANIEIVQNPALKGLPLVVGGSERRGVVSTCSYEARVFGIRSAMSIAEAKKLCPRAVFISGNYSLYKDYSLQIMEILTNNCKTVEIVSIDEAYLDASSEVQNGGEIEYAKMLKAKIFDETALTSSIGFGTSKLIAKIGSSYKKPNGLTFVKEGMEIEFLRPLDIAKLPGVGIKTEAFLKRYGFETIKDLQEASLDRLIFLLGSARGFYLYKASRGQDLREVEGEKRKPKSIGREETFENDIDDIEILKEILLEQLQAIFLKAKEKKLRFKAVSLKLRYHDFKTISKSHTFKTFSQNYQELQNAVLNLFYSTYEGRPPLRLIGVTLENLSDGYWQPTFWDS